MRTCFVLPLNDGLGGFNVYDLKGDYVGHVDEFEDAIKLLPTRESKTPEPAPSEDQTPSK